MEIRLQGDHMPKKPLLSLLVWPLAMPAAAQQEGVTDTFWRVVTGVLWVGD
jgi:hypothetical protein